MNLEIAWRNERHAEGKPRLFRFLRWCFHGWAVYQASWNDVFLCMRRTRCELFLISTTCSFSAKPATLEKFWLHVTQLMLLKTGETLNPGLLVVCLGFECCSVEESDGRAFAVKPVAKYVDEWSDSVHVLEAMSVSIGLN